MTVAVPLEIVKLFPDVRQGYIVMGLAFGFAWTPCIGPVLAAILLTASVQETVVGKGPGPNVISLPGVTATDLVRIGAELQLCIRFCLRSRELGRELGDGRGAIYITVEDA